MNRSVVQKLSAIGITIGAIYLIASAAMQMLGDGLGLFHSLTPDLIQAIAGVVLWKLEPELVAWIVNAACGPEVPASTASAVDASVASYSPPATLPMSAVQDAQPVSIDDSLRQFQAMKNQIAAAVKQEQDAAAVHAQNAASLLAKAQQMGIPNAA